MNNEIIFEAISQINDELIAEAKRTAKNVQYSEPSASAPSLVP